MITWNTISTLAFQTRLRDHTMDVQSKLADAQKEVATGRSADIGLSLGGQLSRSVSIQGEVQRLDQTMTSNNVLASRLTVMQDALSGLVDGVTQFMGELGADLNAKVDRKIVEGQSRSFMGLASDLLNSTFSGEYVFSGIATQSRSVVDYEGADGGAARAAFARAFVDEFGFAPSDPAAAGITGGQLEAFMNGRFDTLFDDANWSTLWSGASQEGIKAKVAEAEIAQVNSTGFGEVYREVMAFSVLSLELSSSDIGDETFNWLNSRLVEKASSVIGKLGVEQASIGSIERRVDLANTNLQARKSVLELHQAELTGVDQYEAVNRLNQLSLRLEASYALTSRMQSLSILNYI